VAAHAGSLPEVVGDAGVLVPAGDPKALAGALRALLGDAEERRTLGHRARVRVLEQFGLERMERAHVDALAAVLARRRSV